MIAKAVPRIITEFTCPYCGDLVTVDGACVDTDVPCPRCGKAVRLEYPKER